MRTEVGRLNTPRQFRAETIVDVEALQLVIGRQTVASLDLDRGGAVPNHPSATRRRELEELVGRSVTRCRHGRGDAAAVVALASQPGDELFASAAGPHQMGVRIDEARNRNGPGGIELRDLLTRCELALGPEPCNPSAFNAQGRILDDLAG